MERGARRTWKWPGALVVCPCPCLGQWLTVGWEERGFRALLRAVLLLSHLAPMVTDFPGTTLFPAQKCARKTAGPGMVSASGVMEWF